MKVEKIRLGLIGKDVSASPGGRMHAFILGAWGIECIYEKFSIAPTELDAVVRTLLGDFDGFNVTIPYKREVFEYLDSIEDSAVACGAVNTVCSATRQGYNTDGLGFMQMLRAAGIEARGKKVLVLGAGGSGRSCGAALKAAGAEVFMYRRNAQELAEVCFQLGVAAAKDPEAGSYDLLVNATGVGMHDTVGRSPVTGRAFAGAEAAVDLIYTPSESEFLRLARAAGLKTCNGAAMLFYQAYYADCLYTGRSADAREAELLYEKYLEREKEI